MSNGDSSVKPTTKIQELFGGAFRVEKFPSTFRDISDIVPISDNQEIFSDINESNPAYSGNQLIIEILDRIDKPDAEAIQFNFNDLGQEQNATDITVISSNLNGEIPAGIAVTGSSISVQYLRGTQKIIPNKRAQGERDFVTLLMCLIRLGAPYNTDLLLTLNVPDKHTDDENDEQNVGESDVYKEFLEASDQQFKAIVSSFTISGDQAAKDFLGI